MDKSMKSLDKCWNDSLSCLDNIYVKVILYVVLILFASKYLKILTCILLIFIKTINF